MMSDLELADVTLQMHFRYADPPFIAVEPIVSLGKKEKKEQKKSPGSHLDLHLDLGPLSRKPNCGALLERVTCWLITP